MTKRTSLFWPFVLAALLTRAVPTLAAPAATPLTPPAVLGAAKTFQFTVTYSSGGILRETSVAAFAQPNKAFIQDTDEEKTKAVDTVFASDGKTQIEYTANRNRYTKSDAVAHLSDMDSNTLSWFVLGQFLTPKAFAKYHHAASDPTGVYRKILRSGGSRMVTTNVLTVSPKTGLPVSWFTSTTPKNPKVPDWHFVFTGWKLNAPVDEGKFAYAPPASATLYTPPKLLADGTEAPDFTANDKDGHPVKLSDYKGKVVVLDFWATWCGPCQMSLPHTTTIAKQYADKGVTVLAVNVWDKPDAFQGWLPKHPEYAPLHFAIDPSKDDSKGIATGLYGVSGIPTQYVIGPDGRVVKSIVGYEDGSKALEDALKAAGVE